MASRDSTHELPSKDIFPLPRTNTGKWFTSLQFFLDPPLFFKSPIDFPRVEEHPEKGGWEIEDPKCDTESRRRGGLGNYPRVIKGKRKDGKSCTERTSEKLPTKPGFVP